jgi:DNA/RNA endonuclease G (NUC1)/V8-like Glu-specific endopeptidase
VCFQEDERLRDAIQSMKASDPALKEELENLEGSAEMMERMSDTRDRFAESPMAEGPVETAETIVFRTGRPVLNIYNDQAVLNFQDAESAVWRDRLNGAKAKVVKAIQAVGRIEVTNHDSYDWLGTGWLVDEDIIVTNRHVASEFARKSGAGFRFKRSIFNSDDMTAAIDFKEEFDNEQSSEFKISHILHIEDSQGPDVAFLRVQPLNGLAGKINFYSGEIKRNSDVVVIGYPAYDSRIPELDLMTRIFGGRYDKKRMAPGRISGLRNGEIIHDCTTLGGNSGSVVLDLDTGDAIGLHFAGRFLKANYAVAAQVVAERLEAVKRGTWTSRPVSAPRPIALTSTTPDMVSSSSAHTFSFNIPLRVTVEMGAPSPSPSHSANALPTSDTELFEEEARREDYLDREGYKPDFLGEEHSVELPEAPRDILTFEEDGSSEHVLRYRHFSVVMCESRRLCWFSAVNIDGKQSRWRIGRTRWRTDPRIPISAQIKRECYGNPPKFSRGHMTRRQDPMWGDSESTASQGNSDSMHVTNAAPQMQTFNGGIWLDLEDYALDNARRDDMRISVFTGPFFRANDHAKHGVKIPLKYWKVIAFIHDQTGELTATGYTMSQESFLSGEEFVFGQFAISQVPISSIENESGVSFHNLSDHDPMGDEESRGEALITDRADIRFV